MARPRKNRKVCDEPEFTGFAPLKHKKSAKKISMTVDEFETIRLIDLVGYTQEECAEQMQVARTTVQGIYNEARKKLAEALVKGIELEIQGGDYALCEGEAALCEKKCQDFCHKKL